jgi:Ricin-type beta-trefoil lectin domain-like
MVRFKVQLHLPGLTIGVDDIQVTGTGRRFGRNKFAGPYLVTNRASGLALDTGLQYEQGPRAVTWPPHAYPHQLWYLCPSGVKGEATIVSAANGLALDSTRETSGDIHPVMWEPNGETWQRWKLEAAADRIGYLIKSPHNGNYLTPFEDARNHLDAPWSPWFSPREGNGDQQWIFSLPYGDI